MQTRSRHAVRILATLAALVLAALALVTGCSSDQDSSGGDLPDPAQLLTQSAEVTRNQQSAHLVITVEGEIEDLPVDVLEGDLTNAPTVAAQGSTDLRFMGQKLEGVKFVVVDGTLYAAMTGDSYQNFGPAADIYDVSAILNPDLGLANVLANFTDARAEGREKIDGVQTVRITGEVSADAVNKIAPQLHAEGPVPGTAWIREDGDHELVQVKLQPKPDTSITMSLSDWGKPVTVTKPAA
ncbi:LppX_LprAFG lipoprotein [uncultured Mycolicibacterium sp.]|uniref:LppX_LprAFG lipoprotein n=1 Tax=uncultured Mycolicibacterium sp. TaxID=2320817 RepID=UPI002633A928|nr:LppX_LprAFG lipoprotein [uncultured Mycolicibacterium sp.]